MFLCRTLQTGSKVLGVSATLAPLRRLGGNCALPALQMCAPDLVSSSTLKDSLQTLRMHQKSLHPCVELEQAVVTFLQSSHSFTASSALTATEVALTMVTLSAVEHVSSEAMKALCAQATAAVYLMTPRDLAAVAKTLVIRNISDIPLAKLLDENFQTKTEEITGLYLSWMMNMFGTFGVKPDGFDFYLTKVRGLAPKLDGRQMAMVLNCMASLEVEDKETLKTLLGESTSIPSVDEITLQGVAMILTACVDWNEIPSKALMTFITTFSTAHQECFTWHGTYLVARLASVVVHEIPGLGELLLSLGNRLVAEEPTGFNAKNAEYYFPILARMHLNDFNLISSLLALLKSSETHLDVDVEDSIAHSLVMLNYPNQEYNHQWLKRCLTEYIVHPNRHPRFLWSNAIAPSSEKVTAALWKKYFNRLKKKSLVLTPLSFQLIHQAFGALKLDFPTLANELSFLYQDIWKQLHTKESVVVEPSMEASKYRESVVNSAKKLGFDLVGGHVLPHINYSVDAFFPGTKVVLDLDQPSHYGAVDTTVPLGETVLKRKVLVGMGYDYIVVGMQDWRRVSNDMKLKEEFLLSLLGNVPRKLERTGLNSNSFV